MMSFMRRRVLGMLSSSSISTTARSRIGRESTLSMLENDDILLREGDLYGAQMMRDVMGSMRSVELQLGAFLIVFSASGMVPMEDILFAVFATIYTWILAKWAYPAIVVKSTTRTPMGTIMSIRGTCLHRVYVMMGALLGFFLPLAFVLGGFSRGQVDGNMVGQPAQAATPHLFLMSAQMLSELLVAEHHHLFSPPVRVLLSLLYSTRRVFCLADWISLAFSHEYHSNNALWVVFGRWLAITNFIYCNINTFFILIPRSLLRAFEWYIMAKNAHRISPLQTSNAQTSNNENKPLQTIDEEIVNQLNKNKDHQPTPEVTGHGVNKGKEKMEEIELANEEEKEKQRRKLGHRISFKDANKSPTLFSLS